MSQHFTNTSKLLALVGALAALALVGPVTMAQATDSTHDQYQTQVQQVSGNLGGGSGTTSPTPSGLQKKVVGGLPFTGLDVVALAAVAVALVTMGFALRRLTAERHTS